MLCNYFFEPSPDIRDCSAELACISKRVILHWKAKKMLTEGRTALRNNEIKRAIKIMQNALKLDPERWEFLELAGVVAHRLGMNELAISYFKQALKSNPCSPSAYLNLLSIVSSEEYPVILETAKKYCPLHPQLNTSQTRDT